MLGQRCGRTRGHPLPARTMQHARSSLESPRGRGREREREREGERVRESGALTYNEREAPVLSLSPARSEASSGEKARRPEGKKARRPEIRILHQRQIHFQSTSFVVRVRLARPQENATQMTQAYNYRRTKQWVENKLEFYPMTAARRVNSGATMHWHCAAEHIVVPQWLQITDIL